MHRALLSVSCAALLLFPAVVFAVDKDQELAVCAAKENSVERLECYDELASKRGVTKPAEKVETKGDWVVRTDQSPVDDSKSVYMTLQAKTPIVTRFGKMSSPLLVMRCKEKKTVAYVNWDTFLGSESGKITYRIDKEKAVTATWGISSDHNAIGRWNGGESIPFMKSLLKRNEIYFRITPYSESPIETSFNVTGLEEAIKPLREACGW